MNLARYLCGIVLIIAPLCSAKAVQEQLDQGLQVADTATETEDQISTIEIESEALTDMVVRKHWGPQT